MYNILMARLLSRKREVNKYLYSKISILLLLVFIFFSGKALYALYKVGYEEASSKRNQYVQKISELEKQKVFLEGKISDMSSPFGEERELRERFNVSRGGEKVIVLVSDDGSNKKDDGFRPFATGSLAQVISSISWFFDSVINLFK